jgi:hypothetical protein
MCLPIHIRNQAMYILCVRIISAYLFVRSSKSMYVCVYVGMFVCMYVCVVRMYMCWYICMQDCIGYYICVTVEQCSVYCNTMSGRSGHSVVQFRNSAQEQQKQFFSGL